MPATLEELRAEAQARRACDLWRRGTRAVVGEGRPDASLVLVGEQPGDREDIAGRPFVGPAGRVLDEALAEAGLDRADLFLTNAVKHFTWREGKGKRRLHDTPTAGEVQACAPWLAAEALVRPAVLVCLGATAVRALLGRRVRLADVRGAVDETPLGAPATATLHPAAVLRAPDEAAGREARAGLAADLAAATRLAAAARPA
ncbi:MAG: UdgX family uracil-DNA binding protein [Thermoleophilia bacterium]